MPGVELRQLRSQAVGGLPRQVALVLRAAERLASLLVELRHRLPMRFLEGGDLLFMFPPMGGEGFGRLLPRAVGAVESFGLGRLDGVSKRLLVLAVALLEGFHVGRAQGGDLLLVLLAERGHLVGVASQRLLEILLDLDPRLVHLDLARLLRFRVPLEQRGLVSRLQRRGFVLILFLDPFERPGVVQVEGPRSLLPFLPLDLHEPRAVLPKLSRQAGERRELILLRLLDVLRVRRLEGAELLLVPFAGLLMPRALLVQSLDHVLDLGPELRRDPLDAGVAPTPRPSPAAPFRRGASVRAPGARRGACFRTAADLPAASPRPARSPRDAGGSRLRGRRRSSPKPGAAPPGLPPRRAPRSRGKSRGSPAHPSRAPPGGMRGRAHGSTGAP